MDDSLEREVGVQSDGHAVPSTGRLHTHLELSVQFILTENILEERKLKDENIVNKTDVTFARMAVRIVR